MQVLILKNTKIKEKTKIHRILRKQTFIKELNATYMKHLKKTKKNIAKNAL